MGLERRTEIPASLAGPPSADCETDETSIRYIMKLAGPLIITTISFTMMQFVDRFMVSRLGTTALAAILPAGAMSFVPGSFAMGIMSSVNIFVSQSIGRGDRKGCSSYFWQASYIGLIYYFIVIAVMWPLAPKIFTMLGQPAEVVKLESVYLRIVICSGFPAVFIWSCNNFFIGIHRPIVTMYASLAAQVVNIASNYVLIFGKFGFPKLGIAGAALGTLLGVLVGAIIRMSILLSEGTNSRYQTRYTSRLSIEKIKRLLKVGMPVGFEFMLNVALWGVILFGLVGRFGQESLAATSVALSCTSLTVMPVVGLGVALTAAMGKSIGEGRKRIAKRQAAVCFRIALIYMAITGICFFIFRKSLMEFWTSDDKVIDIGMKLLIFAAIYQVFHASRIIYSSSLRSAGDTIWLAVVSALSSIVVLGFGGFIAVRFFSGYGALGPWAAATLSIITVGLANRWRFKSNIWMQIDLFERKGVGVILENEAEGD